MNPNSYYIGYIATGQTRFVELSKCKGYQKLYSPSLHPLQNIDNFTTLFTEETLLNYLSDQNLVANFEQLQLYVKSKYSGKTIVRDVTGGIAYQDAKDFFNSKNIKWFYKKNIENPIFLTAVIDFYGYYLKNVEMNEKHPFHYQLALLEILEKFLKQATKEYPRVYAKEKRQKISMALRGLYFMHDFIMYPKKDGRFICEEGTTIKKVNYKGFRDMAMMAYNTDKSIKRAEELRKQYLKEYRKFEREQEKSIYILTPYTANDHNEEFDEYLNEEEVNEMTGKGLKRL